jgi:hypothetical protein
VNFAAVRVDDMSHDAQADSNSGCFAAEFGTETIKPLENLFMLILGNSGAVIFDPNFDPLT